MKLTGSLLAGIIALASLTAGADPLESANWVRFYGCHVAVPRPPLHNNPKLQKAAARLAGGDKLHDAMAAVGYAAARASAVHLSGAFSEAEISHSLAANDCSTLSDPRFREFGAQRRGRDLWMVFGAPAAVPSDADPVSMAVRVLEVVNAARGAGRRCGGKYFAPAAALSPDPALTRAALDHSRDMAAHGEFEHRGHDASTPSDRVQRAGFGSFSIVGENIAAGIMTPSEVADGWLASAAHCENIMDGRFANIGIAYAANPGDSYGLYWTQVFASHRQAPPPSAR